VFAAMARVRSRRRGNNPEEGKDSTARSPGPGAAMSETKSRIMHRETIRLERGKLLISAKETRSISFKRPLHYSRKNDRSLEGGGGEKRVLTMQYKGGVNVYFMKGGTRCLTRSEG